MAFVTKNFQCHDYDISVHTFDFLRESLVFVNFHSKYQSSDRVFAAAFWNFNGKYRILRINRDVDYFAEKIMDADRRIEDLDFDLTSLQEYVRERTGTIPYDKNDMYYTDDIPMPGRLDVENEILSCLKPLKRRLVFGDEEQISALRILSSERVEDYLNNYFNYRIRPLKYWEL